ncbi:hypothetical protein HMPREF3156_01603 [Neisseria sp. HMSC06F02]|nr:hypothetical protein HMPREF3156_01603 [Neisseria sp. HMSC06F02]
MNKRGRLKPKAWFQTTFSFLPLRNTIQFGLPPDAIRLENE